MRIPQDARFRAERTERHFCFTCEDCAFFVPSADGCAHGFPTSEHRLARYDDTRAQLVFCKEWELA